MGGEVGAAGVLTLPTFVLPFELLPASFVLLVVVPLVDFLLLLPLLIAGLG